MTDKGFEFNEGKGLRMVKLFDYQEKVINRVFNSWQSNKIPVMAMCPSAGKTFTSLSIIDRLMSKVHLI